MTLDTRIYVHDEIDPRSVLKGTTMSEHGFKSGPIYRALKRQAEEKTLLVSPYVDSRESNVFLNGYETALSDIALGRIEIPFSNRTNV